MANVDIHRLLTLHRSHRRLATVTAVRPSARFGVISFDGELVARFEEKPQVTQVWIDGGFFVLEPGTADYIESDHKAVLKGRTNNWVRPVAAHTCCCW
ncbi:MAG: sugar phosphate nucleotidyltransferase [Spirochaetota bacterium]